MKRKTLFVLVLLLVVAGLGYAEPKQLFPIKEGFLTGNSYRELSHSGKLGYAMGILDGIFLSPMFDAPKTELQWIERCATGMTGEQVVAVLNRFVSDNPARWHESMNILAWVALKEGCKNRAG